MKRTWKKAACVACVALLASTAAGGQEKLEIFSWWTGDDGAGLQALVQKFDAQYPDVAVTNATATVGPGVDPRSVLQKRMLVGDPPDTFQSRGGQGLVDTWVVANRLEDLKGFYKTQGWRSVFPRDLVSLLSTKTSVWSVPLAVNRCNVMWYVPARLSSWGVSPPRTWGELVNDCQRLKDAGVDAPLALGDSSTLIDLWESVAVATLGPDLWSALWTGKLAFTDPRMLRVWDNFGKVLDFTNPDAPGLTWQQALQRVVTGDSAFMIAGDWAERYLSGTQALSPARDYGWVASPGTAGVFVTRIDSFVLPRGTRNRISAFKWLLTISSRDAQDLFNPLNGSLSPRLDSDAGRYDPYFQSAWKDWRQSRIIGSMAHGVAAPKSFVTRFVEVTGMYVATRDSQAAGNALQAIADQEHLGR